MTDQPIVLQPMRPYLLRAVYEWLNDQAFTPYLLVAADLPGVHVPRQHVRDGQIVLNLAPHAVHQLVMDQDSIRFSARFGGVSQAVHIPVAAAMGLYARENGQGMFFDPSEYASSEEPDQPQDTAESDPPASPPTRKSSLRVLD